MPWPDLIDHYVKAGVFSAELGRIAANFCRDYSRAVPDSHALLAQLVEFAAQQIQQPYSFDCIHRQVREPFDYTQFGLNVISPLIDRQQSSVQGLEHVAKIEQQLAAGDTCIWLANHQTEADPQIMHLLLADRAPAVANMFCVAGDRVTTDPMAVPFSLGTNLICIYSKKHIEYPPEQKEAKLIHNRRAMNALGQLINAGGCCIWVAPSGGRDRADEDGHVAVAAFDPQSVEMFLLLAKKSERPVHFYPLALKTYDLLPPPSGVGKEIGEPRKIKRCGVHLAFGPEIDFAKLPLQSYDKKEQRKERSDAVWAMVHQLYKNL